MKKQLLFIYGIIACWITSLNASAQAPLSCALNGTYTVNANLPANGTNFISFHEIFTRLDSCGVSGPVTINVASGVYNEQMLFKNFPGLGDTTAIIVQADPSDTGSVEVNYNAGYSVVIDHASYITIRGFKLVSTSEVFYISGDVAIPSKEVTIEDNTIISQNAGNIMFSTLPVLYDYTIRNNVIEGNISLQGWQNASKIIGAGTGAVKEGTITRTVITGNTIQGSVSLVDNNFPIVTHNSITAISVPQAGIIVGRGPFALIANNSVSVKDRVGISLSQLGGELVSDTIGSGGRIVNNVIRVLDNSLYGMEILGYYIDVLHNTIHVDSSAATAIAMVFEDFAEWSNIGASALTGHRLLNNNITNNAGGKAIFVNSGWSYPGKPDLFAEIDHNNYYTTGDTLGVFDEEVALDLQEWRSVTFKDVHSISTDPLFSPDTSLRPHSLNLIAGLSLAEVPLDINGISRGSVPAIGAIEVMDVTGGCDSFSGFVVDSVKGGSFIVDWTPGNQSSSYYLEYGPQGFVRGDTSSNLITGIYPGGQSSVKISGLSPESTYDVYFGEICNSGSDSVYFNKLSVTTAAACPWINGVDINNTDIHSASFSIISLQDSFDIEWGYAGYEQGTGTSIKTGRSFTLDTLGENTAYDLYIRTNCESTGEGTTGWFGPISFITDFDCAGPLSGNYTIGGSPGPRNFNTFREAADQLNNCGVSGPVVINVAGTTGRDPYNENFVLKDITGASLTNTITIQAQSPVTNPAELRYKAFDPEDNYVILFQGASYITIKDLKIATGANLGQDDANVIVFAGEGEYIALENNEITGKENAVRGGGSSDWLTKVVIRSLRQSNYNYCRIENNIIRRGYTGLYLFSGKGNSIVNNEIKEFSVDGINIFNQDSLLIRKNTVTPSPLYAAIRGMFPECAGISLFEVHSFRIIENTFSGSAKTPVRHNMMGIKLTNVSSGLIANNMISTAAGLTNSFGHRHGAIDLNASCTDIDILYNSVITRSKWARSLFILGDEGGMSGIKLLNNNFVSLADGPGESTEPTVVIEVWKPVDAISRSDYNNFYSTGDIGVLGTTTATSLSDWQTLSGQDSNSITVNPHFAGEDDLHVLSSALHRKGTPVDTITTDIDEEERSATAPDIGADELSSSGCFSSFDFTALETYADSIILNWGAGSGITYLLEYDSTGFNKGAGNMVKGITDSFYTITGLSPQTTYDFYLQDSCESGDTSIWIGPVSYTTPCADADILSGTYTIDGSQATGGTNFARFGEAVAIMNSCGIKGPVVFNVAEGTYIEQIELNDIRGVSEVNTITFQADTANETPVYLRYSGGMNNNYVIRFTDIDHITIKGLNVSAVNPLYGTVISFKGDCSHIVIENNHISGVPSERSILDTDQAIIVNPEEAGKRVENITIRANRIYNGSNAIYGYGDRSDKEKNMIIEDNVIRDFSGAGILLLFQDSTRIAANRVTAKRGIGVSLNSCLGFEISNNIISTIEDDGMDIAVQSRGFLYYNTIYVSGEGSALNILAAGMTAYNNNFINTGGGYAVEELLSVHIGGAVLDHNNIYTVSGPLGSWSGTEATDLASWRTLSGGDNNSISADPLFISPDSFYSNSPLVNDQGTPITEITTDIDGSPRSASTPDIGANEFDSVERDMMMSALAEPLDSSCGDLDAAITVVVSNAGTQPASGFTVGASIRGITIANPSVTYSGTLHSGALDTVYLTSVNSVNGGVLQIMAYVNLSGDLETTNDTMETSLQIKRSDLLSPVAAKGFFCESGGYDTLYFPTNIEDSLLTWLTASGDTLSSNDSLVVGPLGDRDTTFVLSVSGEDCYAGGEVIIEAPKEVTASFTVALQSPEMTRLTAIMNADSSTGANSYQWNFGDGSTATGETISHDYMANGMYDVQLIVTGNCGSDTLIKTIEVHGISIEENILSRSLSVYPNPTQGKVQLSFETGSSDEVILRLTDLSGKVIWKETAKNVNGRYEGEIDLGHVAKGGYMLRIESGELRAVKRILRN